MSLVEYRKKRTLKRTPEPTGGKSDRQVLRFVVQKHDASHLHYDFRLEMGKVLKSWAVPKGPSMNPKVKRLAMEVEDHPYDYRTFEGVIPEGNYGAGTVMVWDEGTYHAVENFPDKRSEDADLQRQWNEGKIRFRLSGKKLKGEFALVKASWRGNKSWLLMKLKDDEATTEDILLEEQSAVTGRTLDEITQGKKKTSTRSGHAGRTAVPSKEKKTTRKKLSSKIPNGITPMLTTLVDKPFDQPGWVYEIKWDGYRALAFINDGRVELRSRNDKSFNDKFYPVYKALKNWDANAVVDGEIVVLKPNGQSDFGSLQNWRSEADGDLAYFVFDILWLDGEDLTRKTLKERKEILKSVMPDSGIIKISDTFNAKGSEFYESARRMGLEGIIAKRENSMYHTGARTTDWLKIKINQRQEVVIGGYTRNVGSPKPFSALLVGVFDNEGKFIYTGKIGTGFNDKQQREILKVFKDYETDKVPFSTLPDYNKPSRFNPRPSKATATWLRPKLVCEVSFTEMTTDGVMRHPSFEGMRVDKAPKDVKKETPKHTEEVIEKKASKKQGKAESIVAPHSKRERTSLLNPKDKQQVRPVEGHEIKFTNLDKVYWPANKKIGQPEPVTKRDMLNYYYQVAPYILPYLEDRPQSLNRFPNGIKGKGFYQKDVTGKVPEWVDTYLYHTSDEPNVDRHFLVPRSEADVMLMASMGCIEMNPWSSRTARPDHPDWCIIDLDPGTTSSFEHVIEAARVTHDILESVKLPSYCKTSGSTGIHIYVPLGAKYTYEESKEFARTIVTYVHGELPSFTSIERIVSKRKGKMYLDFLQNRPQATLAAPYSLRPKPGAPVSMPLQWDEVKKGLKITDFNINNAAARIREMGDIFKPVLGPGIDLQKFSKNINT